jgi:hypothetical protein
MWASAVLIGWAIMMLAQGQKKTVVAEQVSPELGATQAPALMQPEPTSPSAPKPPMRPLPSPGPHPVAPLDHPDVRYRILQHLGDIYVCYRSPWSLADNQRQIDAFPKIRNDSKTFSFIVERLRLETTAVFSDEQKVSVYGEYEKLAVIILSAFGNEYRFRAYAIDRKRPIKGADVFLVDGRVDARGQLTIIAKQPTWDVPCPRCLARGTRIDTPAGTVLVEDLRPGAMVWTLDAQGKQVARPVVAVAAVPVSQQHVMVRLVFTDGRELWVSPGHPTVDGRMVVQLKSGSAYSGGNIERMETVSYADGITYDLAPAGDTGFYWANGVLLASTLRESQPEVGQKEAPTGGTKKVDKNVWVGANANHH